MRFSAAMLFRVMSARHYAMVGCVGPWTPLVQAISRIADSGPLAATLPSPPCHVFDDEAGARISRLVWRTIAWRNDQARIVP
ncbi:hypothetical protein [Starkeya nomas]|uniref:hypothetical protein n=1 Tax=Starkeya nomas TaxID=2666134 RepID=UPI00135AA96A|nr:hypothetical protein [Starkeya nomas]